MNPECNLLPEGQEGRTSLNGNGFDSLMSAIESDYQLTDRH